MSGFLVAFIATVLAGVGARDQVLVAGFAARQGERPVLLLIALASAALSAAGVVWLALAFAPQLDPAARRMLAVLVLGLAGLEMIAIRPRATPNEPTQSLGAFAIVLVAQQLTDATRFLLFAIVMASQLPLATGLGGALGGMAVVSAGWMGGQALLDLPLERIRRWLGMLALVTAVALFLALR